VSSCVPGQGRRTRAAGVRQRCAMPGSLGVRLCAPCLRLGKAIKTQQFKGGRACDNLGDSMAGGISFRGNLEEEGQLGFDRVSWAH